MHQCNLSASVCFIMGVVLIEMISQAIDMPSRVGAEVRVASLNQKRLSCAAELSAANRTFSDWSVKVRQIINDSSLQGVARERISREESKLHQLIADFASHLNKKPIEKSVKDLVAIKRQSNRVALDAYLKTHDARWPQNSVQLGVIVERVQQACLSTLDRATMMVLNNSNDISTYIQEKGGKIKRNYAFD